MKNATQVDKPNRFRELPQKHKYDDDSLLVSSKTHRGFYGFLLVSTYIFTHF